MTTAAKIRESILEFIEDQNFPKLYLNWGVFILAFAFLLYGPRKCSFVKGDSMEPILKQSELYSTVNVSKICVGDIVQTKEIDENSIEVRAVTAIEGSSFSIHENGYLLDGIKFEQSERWVAKATQTLNPTDAIIVPSGHVILMRKQPDVVSDDKYEAFQLLEISNIDRRFHRIILSMNPLRIGRKIQPGDHDCIDNDQVKT